MWQGGIRQTNYAECDNDARASSSTKMAISSH